MGYVDYPGDKTIWLQLIENFKGLLLIFLSPLAVLGITHTQYSVVVRVGALEPDCLGSRLSSYNNHSLLNMTSLPLSAHIFVYLPEPLSYVKFPVRFFLLKPDTGNHQPIPGLRLPH